MPMTAAEVRTAMLAKLEASGLANHEAKRLKLEPFTKHQLIKNDRALTHLPAAGFKIPYFNILGEPTDFYRYRYLEEPTRHGFDALTQHKSLRYIQPAGLSPRVYFPKILDWKKYIIERKGKERIVFITEGELKAACATKFDIPCIALGGVWNFRSQKTLFIDDLQEIDWKDACVYIVYDSDARSNFQVLRAENALAGELLTRGAHISIIRLPELIKDQKTGLDDYLVARGRDEFIELVTRTEPWEISRILHKLNEEVIFIRKTSVVLEIADMHRMSVPTFTQGVYANWMLEEQVQSKNGSKLVKKPAAVAWVHWDARAEVKDVTYAPGEPRVTESNKFNTWSGWGLPTEIVKRGSISLWQELLACLLNGATIEERTWFEQWLAYPLQHPGTKLLTAAVVWGRKQGTGKTLLGYTMQRIYGNNFAEIADTDFQGNFNEWAENKQFVMGDEITGGDKRVSSDRMKSLITRGTIRINAKFIPTYTVPDCVNYYFTSNHSDSFFLEEGDRRYFVHEVKTPPLPDEFYKEYEKWYKSDAVGALFFHLLNLDLTGFNPSAKAPETAAKKEMTELGRSEIAAWVANLRENPDNVLITGSKQDTRSLLTTEELHRIFDPMGTSRLTRPGMAKALKTAGFERSLISKQQLWIVRNGTAHKSVAELTEIYQKERKPICKPNTTINS